MQTMDLFEGIEFSSERPEAQALYVSRNGRVIRWNLKPGQSIKQHNVPDSPFYVVVLQGNGMFAGGDQKEFAVGEDTLVVFEPGENHTIRAIDDELVFIGFLAGAPSNESERVGGMMGHAHAPAGHEQGG